MAVHLYYIRNHRAIVLATMTPTGINIQELFRKILERMEKEKSGV